MPISEELLQRIRDNDSTLTSLDLRDNQIGVEGAQALASALKHNTTLAELNLERSQIEKEGAEAIAEVFTSNFNTNLRSLNLNGNRIGNEGVKAILEGLKHNKTVRHLDLESNQIGSEGVKFIADELKTNKILRSLDLASNLIGNEGAEFIAEALKTNTILKSLNLKGNQISDEGAIALASGIEFNTTLFHLNLVSNFRIVNQGENRATETISEIKREDISKIARGNLVTPSISYIMRRIIFDNSEEEFSDSYISFILGNSRSIDCVKILENLVRDQPNENIPNVLQKVQNMKGAIGATILLKAIEALESGLSRNKLNLPEDKLKLITDQLIENELSNFLRAGAVTKEGVKGGLSCNPNLSRNSEKILLSTDPQKLILEFLDGKNTRIPPSPTNDEALINNAEAAETSEPDESMADIRSTTPTTSVTPNTAGNLRGRVGVGGGCCTVN